MRKQWFLALWAWGSAAVPVTADDLSPSSSPTPPRVRAVVRIVPSSQDVSPSATESKRSEENASGSDEEPARFATPAVVSPQGELPASATPAPRELEPHRAGEIATRELAQTTSALSVELSPLPVAAPSEKSRGFVLAVEHQRVGTTDLSRVVLRLPPGTRLARLEPSIGWIQDEKDSSCWTRSLKGIAAGDRREWRGYLDGADVRGRIEARVESWAEVFDEVTEPFVANSSPATESNDEVADAVAPTLVSLRCEGPARGELGATLIYKVRIVNSSDSVLEGVELVPDLDNGLYLEGRRQLMVSEPIAARGEAILDVAVRAGRVGEQLLRFELRRGDQELTRVEHRVQIEDSGVEARLEGAASAAVGTETAFAIHVEHRGQMALEDVVVTLSLPPGLRVTKVEHEAGYDTELRMMAWRIVHLEPRSSVVLRYRAVVESPGDLEQQIDVSHGAADEVVSDHLVTRARPSTTTSPRTARAIPLRDPVPKSSNRD